MYVTDSIRIFYTIYFISVCLFFTWFIRKIRKSDVSQIETDEKKSGIDKRELRFFLILISIIILAHIITISNMVPWQRWRLWSKPIVVKTYNIEVSDYNFKFPEEPITFEKNQFVEFVLNSTDVTYGFGVFRKDGTLVFQIQVLPGYKNRFVWNFSQSGYYDVRSTEYSGPKHSDMVVYDAIKVL
ncbi:MAG: hypothetical protein AABY84_05155 [Candidatus Firestonebacteria bacterium]